ncbi:MAG: hypothetical protein Q7R92_02630 [bacterium]|nr:hypothetical protein [bacterium]
MGLINLLRLRRPKGMHIHLRQDDLLKLVVMFSNIYGWVLDIGNLLIPIKSPEQVRRRREEIEANNISFKFLLSVMLTEDMMPDLLEECHEAGADVLKYQPFGTTTNSQFGVRLEKLREKYDVLERALELRMIFTGHWELPYNPLTGKDIPLPLREELSIPYLSDVIDYFPGLTIGVEHISGRPMLQFVQQAPLNVFGGITAHHMGCTRADMRDQGSFNPHYSCRPVLKDFEDCLALMTAVSAEDNDNLIFTPDCAPHLKERKETMSDPPVGIFAPGHIGIPLIIQGLENVGLPIRETALNNFFSYNAERIYSLPPADDEIVLVREPCIVPAEYNGIVPLWAGRQLNWQMKEY